MTANRAKIKIKLRRLFLLPTKTTTTTNYTLQLQLYSRSLQIIGKHRFPRQNYRWRPPAPLLPRLKRTTRTTIQPDPLLLLCGHKQPRQHLCDSKHFRGCCGGKALLPLAHTQRLNEAADNTHKPKPYTRCGDGAPMTNERPVEAFSRLRKNMPLLCFALNLGRGKCVNILASSLDTHR